MNCQQALDRLYDMIDKEVSEVDAREIQKHLDHCRDCFERHRVEKNVQDFINEKLKDAKPSPGLGNLRQSILTNLDSIDASNEKERSFRIPPLVLAAAASLALIIGVWTLGFRHDQNSRIYGSMETLHTAIVNDAQVADSLQLMATVGTVCSKLGYELSPIVQGYSLVNACFENVSGVEMGHFVYSDGGDLVSVFLVEISEYDVPGELTEEQVVIDGTTFYDHQCRTCRLVFHRAGRTLVVTASSDPATDLLAFVPGRAIA